MNYELSATTAAHASIFQHANVQFGGYLSHTQFRDLNALTDHINNLYMLSLNICLIHDYIIYVYESPLLYQ